MHFRMIDQKASVRLTERRFAIMSPMEPACPG